MIVYRKNLFLSALNSNKITNESKLHSLVLDDLCNIIIFLLFPKIHFKFFQIFNNLVFTALQCRCHSLYIKSNFYFLLFLTLLLVIVAFSRVYKELLTPLDANYSHFSIILLILEFFSVSSSILFNLLIGFCFCFVYSYS